MDLIFQSSFRLTEKLSGTYRVPTSPLSPHSFPYYSHLAAAWYICCTLILFSSPSDAPQPPQSSTMLVSLELSPSSAVSSGQIFGHHVSEISDPRWSDQGGGQPLCGLRSSYLFQLLLSHCDHLGLVGN